MIASTIHTPAVFALQARITHDCRKISVTGRRPPFAENICSAFQSSFINSHHSEAILMMKMEKQTSSPVWLRFPGYRVAALKPEFGEAAIELERAIHEGIPAYPDSARTDFYDVAVEGGWAYIHVRRNRQAVYLVAQFASTFGSFSANGAGRIHDEFRAAIR